MSGGKRRRQRVHWRTWRPRRSRPYFLAGARPPLGRVVMPPLVHLVPLLRPLPVALFDAVNDFLGVNVSMDRFVGRRNGPADAD